MHNGHIHLDDISKVEGHARLSLDVKKGKVENAEFKVSESNRFFEQIIVGKPYHQIPLIVSRICGFCSTSHCTTAIEAVEKAFRVEISEQTLMLRELLVNAEFIKSHSLHLFFLALPDYLGKESVLGFSKAEHKYIHLGLELKNTATSMLETIGGRAYHTTNELAGGFKLVPTKAQIAMLIDRLEKCREYANEAIELFSAFDSKFSRETDYVALVGKDYSLLVGDIVSSAGVCIPEELYSEYLKEIIVPYSYAKQANFAGKEFMVGALARLNLNKENLGREVKKIMKRHRVYGKFPNHSPFMNNLAQAVEICQCIDSSIYLLNQLKPRSEQIPKIRPVETVAVGVTEAPRGILCHKYRFDREGRIAEADIIVPTAQNQRNIEEDIKEFLPPLLKKPRKEIEFELEKLIRAYDPCISCASHFLEVNWK